MNILDAASFLPALTKNILPIPDSKFFPIGDMQSGAQSPFAKTQEMNWPGCGNSQSPYAQSMPSFDIASVVNAIFQGVMGLFEKMFTMMGGGGLIQTDPTASAVTSPVDGTGAAGGAGSTGGTTETAPVTGETPATETAVSAQKPDALNQFVETITVFIDQIKHLGKRLKKMFKGGIKNLSKLGKPFKSIFKGAFGGVVDAGKSLLKDIPVVGKLF